MNLTKLIFKFTFRKSKAIYETIIAVAIVTSMMVIFTNTAIMVSKAYTAVSSYVSMKSDMSFFMEDKTEALELYNKLHAIDNYKYSHFRTSEIKLKLSQAPMYKLCISGAEGDYLTLYDYVLLEGRMPEEAYEVIVSDAFLGQLETSIKIGDVINGEMIPQIIENAVVETNEESYSFLVVGIFSGASTDSYDIEAFTTIETAEELFDNVTYSVCIGTEANDIDTLSEITQKEVDILYQSVIPTHKVKCQFNNNRLIFMEEKISVGGHMTMVFHGIAIFLAMASVFMIYNIISASIYKRINEYGMLRSMGYTSADIIRNCINSLLGVIFIGGAIGCVIGWFINKTVGSFLVSKMIGSMDLMIRDMIFQNYPESYLEAFIFTSISVFIANAMIWKKSLKLSIIEQIKYGEQSEVYVGKAEKEKNDKKIICLLGDRNIRRNRNAARCSFMNFFFVGTIISFIIVFLSNIDFRGLNIYQKAEFCDYEVSLDWMSGGDENFLSESELNDYKVVLAKSSVYGILEDLSFSACDAETEEKCREEFLHQKEVDSIEELSMDDIAEFSGITLVSIYIAEDEVLRNMLSGERKYDYNDPLVLLVGNKEEQEIIIYDTYDKAYSLCINGNLETNYMRNVNYGARYDLVLNYEAAERYLGMKPKYSGFLVKTEENEEKFKSDLFSIAQKQGKQVSYSPSYSGQVNALEQGKSIMYIATYIAICFFVMVISNIICTMRVVLIKRKKELGILIVLGMLRNEVIRLISYESRKICFRASMLSIVLGTIVSIYFLEATENEINVIKSVIAMIAAFTICYGTTITVSRIVGGRLLSKTELVTNMEEE